VAIGPVGGGGTLIIIFWRHLRQPLIFRGGILSLIAFYEVALGASACYIKIAPWIFSEMFDASWGFFGDREVTG
jgi:hypothetical protein